jgi:hypothetical protein
VRVITVLSIVNKGHLIGRNEPAFIVLSCAPSFPAAQSKRRAGKSSRPDALNETLFVTID